MKLNIDWLKDFPTTQAIAFVAMFLIVAMCVKAIVLWVSPPEGLAIFLGGLVVGGVAQFAVKRTTDHQYVRAKSDRDIGVAVARASASQPAPQKVTTTTVPEGTTVTEVEPAPPGIGGA